MKHYGRSKAALLRNTKELIRKERLRILNSKARSEYEKGSPYFEKSLL